MRARHVLDRLIRMNSERFAALLSNIRDIPALPDVVVKVMRMTRDPEVSAAELNSVIGLDPALTGNILKLCNSAYYGLPRVISSVTQAIMYLGFHTVRNLVLTCALSDLLGGDRPMYGHGKGGLWLHSIACAVASQKICESVNTGLKDTAFTAGLLQDIGKVIIHEQVKDTETSIEEVMVEQGLSLTAAEQSILGYTHADIGAALADRWNFPVELVHAIHYHHDPSSAPSRSILTSIVHVADTCVLERRFGVEMDQLLYPTASDALEEIGLEQAKVDTALSGLDAMVDKAMQAFNMGAK